MKGAAAKRGTHGLRKRCQACRKLRKFVGNAGGRDALLARGWRKGPDGRWRCPECRPAEATCSPS